MIAYGPVGVLPLEMIVLSGIDISVQRVYEFDNVAVVGVRLVLHVADGLPHRHCHDSSEDEWYDLAHANNFQQNFLTLGIFDLTSTHK